MNEKQLTILGFRIWKFAFGIGVWSNEGTPHSVAMDARKPLQWRKWVIGFYHTHPNMMNFPSGIDIFTMFAWCNALGKSIYCLIEGYDAVLALICPSSFNRYTDFTKTLPGAGDQYKMQEELFRHGWVYQPKMKAELIVK